MRSRLEYGHYRRKHTEFDPVGQFFFVLDAVIDVEIEGLEPMFSFVTWIVFGISPVSFQINRRRRP